jgi:two-component sensor histidine kinase
LSERVKPYSADALGIALASISIATVLRFMAGWANSDVRFAIYLPAILAIGLLAGVPAAASTAIASILIIVWAFIPPHFQLKWLDPAQEMDVLFNAVPYLITVYFAYCCRVVLLRLHRGELNNQVLVRELEHRGRNIFSIIEVIVQKTLVNDPENGKKIAGRLRSVRHSHELLTGESQSIGFRELLLAEFAPYNGNLRARGPDFNVEPENARHLILLFHELTTNAVKHGALSRAEGRVFVDWEWDGSSAVVKWEESGGPLVRQPDREGFGGRLIALCVKSLSGTIQPDYSVDGLKFSMILKLG